jgi:hypothetical protein
MKYLRKFATEADVVIDVVPCVAFVAKSKRTIYGPLPKNGVYIQHIEGKLYKTDAWTANGFTASEANGIAVIDDACAFVLAKGETGSSTPWLDPAAEVSGVMATTNLAVAKTDFAGLNNTMLIAEMSGYSAAKICVNYIFPNGKTGYLPAVGEIVIAYNYKEEINAALSLIGGTSLDNSGYIWTSTQRTASRAWRFSPSTRTPYDDSKSNNYRSRPFTTL